MEIAAEAAQRALPTLPGRRGSCHEAVSPRQQGSGLWWGAAGAGGPRQAESPGDVP